MSNARALFGTDGIRDIAGEGRLAPETVLLVGRALGAIAAREPELLAQSNSTERTVLIGRDTRASGEMIRDQLTEGLVAEGCNAIDVGVAPTPVVAFLTTHCKVSAGVVISASHNPAGYNGIKVFGAKGFKAADSAEARIEELVASPDSIAGTDSPGSLSTEPGLLSAYIDHVTKTVRNEYSIEGIRIVADLAHGATCTIAPQVLGMLGAKVIPVCAAPDGTNINVDSGALHPETVSSVVRAEGADIGLAFDGDGDRMILSDEAGNILDGDYQMAIAGRYLKGAGRLTGDLVVATVMSNVGLERSLSECGARLLRVDVGDRVVAAKMLETGAVLGGEQSGHVIFRNRSNTGDGIWSALGILEVMAKTGRKLSELASCMKKYPQVLVNVKVKEKPDNILSIGSVKTAHEGAIASLGGAGRVLVRYSGTEPLARVMVEGEDVSEINEHAKVIAGAIEKEIGE